MKKKKIYIAGKVSGLPLNEVLGKFAKAFDKIEALGFEAVNPVELVQDYLIANPTHIERTEDEIWKLAMRICIKELVDCDGIMLLSNWINSKGAKIEYRIAMDLDLAIFGSCTDGMNALKWHVWNS